jgi:hypothetical protein
VTTLPLFTSILVLSNIRQRLLGRLELRRFEINKNKYEELEEAVSSTMLPHFLGLELNDIIRNFINVTL